MKTASFFEYGGLGRISIARWAPRKTPAGFRIYRPLAPGVWFNKVTRPEYERLYADQLGLLDAARTWEELHTLADGSEPVLLCWERSPFTDTNWCHRRLVAHWFERSLGVEVPELAR